jgi:hypothetical protein
MQVSQRDILKKYLLKAEIDPKPFPYPSFNHMYTSSYRSYSLKKDFPEGLLPFHGGISFWFVGECAGSANLCAKGTTITEVTGHRPFRNGMKHWSGIRTGIDTGLAADA